MNVVVMSCWFSLNPNAASMGNLGFRPNRNQLARTVADAFYNNFILHYGIPERIPSDQGANFESTIIKELCTQCCVDGQPRVSPEHQHEG
jgi:hypothetical protein